MDIEKAIEQFKRCHDKGCGVLNSDNRDYINFVRDILEKYRDGKMIEVVRCKDCMYWDEEKPHGDFYNFYYCDMEATYTKKDSYCQSGKAKEGESK